MTSRWLIDLHRLKDALRGCNVALDIEHQCLRLPDFYCARFGYDVGVRKEAGRMVVFMRKAHKRKEKAHA